MILSVFSSKLLLCCNWSASFREYSIQLGGKNVQKSDESSFPEYLQKARLGNALRPLFKSRGSQAGNREEQIKESFWDCELINFH